MDDTRLGGRYRLVDRLGEGGMSVVWRAEDLVLGRLVAVKVLAEPYADQKHRIRAEARAVARLSHPNIAHVFDFGEQAGKAYIVMELVDGPTLEQRLLEGPLDPNAAFRVCAQVAAALAAAHGQGIVHRDIKPANVMLTARGAKVVDFGIAAAASPAEVLRNTKRDESEELLGTPAYLAPERLTASAVEPASDVYALGVLLYKLLTGDLPWRAETATDLLEAHLHIEPRPLPRLPGMPDEVAELFRRSLRKDPAKRPTAREMTRVLSAARDVRARPAAPVLTFFNDSTVPLRVATVRPQWTNPRARVAVATLAAVVVTVGSWLLSPSSDNSAVPAGPQQAAAQTAPTDPTQNPPDSAGVAGQTPPPATATTPPTTTTGHTTKRLVTTTTAGKDNGKDKGKSADAKGKGPGPGKGPKG